MRSLLRPAVTVAVIAFVARVDGAIGIAVALAVLGVAVWSYPPLMLRSVEVARAHPKRVFHGEAVDIEYSALNRGRLPVPWLSVSDPVPFDLGIETTRWVVSLRGGEERSMVRTIEAKRRGVYRLGPATVASGDFFGMRRAESGKVAPSLLIVYPQIVPLRQLGIDSSSPLPVVPTGVPLYADPTRMIGVRSYAPGDRYRDIHWKASAARGDLLTKQFQPGIDRDVVIALDLSLEAHPYPGRRRSIELAVTVAASIVHHLITALGQPVGLRMVAVDAPTGASAPRALSSHPDQGHLSEVLETLARARASSRPDTDFLIDQAGLGYGSSLVMVTGLLDPMRCSALMRARRRGPTVSVIATGRDPDGGLVALLRGANVPVLPVSGRADLELI
ncbi:MAG: DUF58 domain-containing protein [Acidimicrobiia bacterium]|nr:DUF58 domain-containing protein [Acidimicrobiia bacterium]